MSAFDIEVRRQLLARYNHHLENSNMNERERPSLTCVIPRRPRVLLLAVLVLCSRVLRLQESVECKALRLMRRWINRSVCDHILI